MARTMPETHRREASLLIAVLTISMACNTANAALSLLGVQYQEDEPYTEYRCLWQDGNYPTSCGVDLPGANLHVFLKNDGASAVTLDDVTLEDYSLETVLKEVDVNGHICNSIWFYWDDPPAAILNAGEPAWYKMEPASIAPGEVGQVIVRLRRLPTTSPLDVDVDTSANTIYADITVDHTVPLLANVSFSQDLKKVYMYWRRAGGAAPATIKMDGTDVTSDTVTVGDPSINYAVTIYTRSTALTELSYHVFQGVYSDSATATGGLRIWKNPFIYGSWAAFDTADGDYDTAQDWIDTCYDRGMNTLEMNSASSGLMDYLGTSAGRTYADNHHYGFIKDTATWGTWSDNPRLWFIDDEADCEEANLLNNHCGTGYKLPCNTNQAATMGMHYIEEGEGLRNIKDRPTTINMDGTWKPYSWYGYGQVADVLCIDSYYQALQGGAYYERTNTIPLYEKATIIYATSLAGSRAAEPSPFRILLDSCLRRWDGHGEWPFADPETKRTEVYYALAGGAKGINYWWFKDSGGSCDGLCGNNTNLVPEDAALWKEIGLLGAEIKLLQPYLVTSHPVELDVTGSTNVWVKGLARGTDTLILFAINDNHYNDENGWNGTDTTNAMITVTLPDWMTYPTPTAFEVNREGLKNVSTTLNGDQMELSIGTLSVARLFVVTTDPTLRMTIQDRYDNVTWPGICNFASDVCNAITDAPMIVAHPTNQSVIEGETATFLVAASGGSQFSFQWQKNGANLSNGGHYSGCTTFALTVSSINSSDEANYRCVVTNPYGSATSNAAALTLSTVDITQQPTPQSICPGGTAQFDVSATGEGTLTYRWQKNQVNLNNGGHYSGVMTATLTVSNADSNDEADYRCAVTDNTSTLYSDQAALTLRPAVSITQQPSNQIIEEGATAVFNVTADGTGTLTYQWQKDQVNVSNGGHYSGVTTTTLTIANVDSGDEADYRCVVTDDCGSVNSNTASLTIDVCGNDLANSDFEGGFTGGIANSWTSYVGAGDWTFNNAAGYNSSNSQRVDNPNARNDRWAGFRQTFDANVGDAFTFTAIIYCNSNSNNMRVSLRVDWAGGTTRPGSELVLSSHDKQVWTPMGTGSGNATGTSVTLFCDMVGNTDNKVDGDTRWDNVMAYRAHVPPAPAVASASSTSIDVNVDPGCNADNNDTQYAITIGGGAYTLGTHWVQANGTVSTSAVWQTDSTWGTREVTGLTTGTTYTFKVKARYNNALTQETSQGAGTEGTPEDGGPTPPTITQHPSAQNVCAGGTAQFNVAATGEGTLTYQWQKNQVNLSNGGHYSGVTTTTLIVSNADSSDVANYRCVVTNDGGSTNSNTAALTLSANTTTITSHPEDVTADPGWYAEFSVSATGSGTLTYQWQKDQVDLVDDDIHIFGANDSWLIIDVLVNQDSGQYRCIVTGDCGSATSNEATLTINGAGIPGDFDQDGDVDMVDFGEFQACLSASGQIPSGCDDRNLNGDDAVDATDLGIFLQCLSGEEIPANPNCAD